MKSVYRILVVDDHEDMRETTVEALADEGYAVNSAQNGEEAIKKAKKEKYDLMLLDWKLPKLDGLDVLKEIRSELKDMYILFFSAVASAEIGKKAIELGADDCIDKPNELEKLRLITKKIINEIDLRIKNRLFIEEEEKKYKIVGNSEGLINSLKLSDKVASTDSSVLLRGETGTGKELFARYIHKQSNRKDKPFVAVNCSAINETLFETEIFGHSKGAFTGAVDNKEGRLEVVKGGTLFLDEIGDISLASQSKLLRVLEDKIFTRLGSNVELKTDFRLIGATNKDLDEMVEKESFRSDFFYRINQFPIFIPSLRERIDDIPLLIKNIIEKGIISFKKGKIGISDDSINILLNYKFPGNIRELENIINHALILAQGDEITVDDLSFKINNKRDNISNLYNDLKYQDAKQSFEQDYVKFNLAKTKGNISHAADITGIDRKQLRKKIDEYNIDVSKYKRESNFI